ncbi:MAG: UMP kinase [Puniceicoccales bacterium]|jgi:uridylate kinase|nr:UMP kinase [Puniceicoccales bacterium]
MANPYHRILIKLSGEILRDGARGEILNPKMLTLLADELKELHQEKIEVALVIGGGNIFRGLAGQHQGIERIRGDHMGMLSTVINALAIEGALRQNGLAAQIQLAVEMPQIAELFRKDKAIRALQEGRILLFAGGTGSPLFSTDTAAALRAVEIEADVIFKATKVDGVYDKDPLQYPDAVKYETVSFPEVMQKGLQIMDAAAFALCMENQMPVRVFDMQWGKRQILRAARGESLGTLIQ